MTDSMLAAVLVEPGRFDLREVARPVPGPHEALIRVARTGICGTDIHIFHGHYAADRLPLIPGHEFTGHIAAYGQDVTNLTEGQPVVVDMNIGCTRCYWCRQNEILNCPEMQQIGITIDGAFAEYLSLPARLVIPVSEEVPAETLALAEPLSCVVRAARKSSVTFGRSVVIIGAGPMGNLHVQLMRTIGAAPIIVMDVVQQRVDMALKAGADIGVTGLTELRDAIARATDGRGADIVIESVGRRDLYAEAQTLARKGGHLMAFGLTGQGETLNLEILSTILEENSVRGSVAGMGEDLHDALTLLTHKRINTDFFTTSAWPLTDIQTAFDSFADRPQDLKTQIVIS